MALKNHELDEKIIEAARSEFLSLGYEKASLRTIASKAGTTSGALYTRYESKDELFVSLISDLLEIIKKETANINEVYMKGLNTLDLDMILDAIELEEQTFLDVLYAHYEDCVLFFCRSKGSSIDAKLKTMLRQKAKQTVNYINVLAKGELDLTGLDLIIIQQFGYYRKILEKHYTKDEAYRCLSNIMLFQRAGWKELFQAALKR